MSRGLALLVTTLALLGPGAAAASAAPLDEVVMYSDSGDYIGGGQMRLYHPGNGRITVGGSTSFLTVSVSGGSLGDAYSMDFAAPPGQVLAPGVYDDAQRASFRESGRPGIDISGDGRGCNEDTGRFEVKAFDVTPDGVLQRLWIVYEQHCEGGVPALFGEVRLGMGGGSGPLGAAPSVVRWPVRDFGGAGTVVPVTFVAASPTTVGSATVVGDQFTERLDECSGKTLAAGSGCQVWVRFTPTAAGTQTGTLRVTAGGTTNDVLLQGFTHGGRTRVVMDSDSGDYIGQGQHWSYTPANATIGGGGTRQGVSFGLDGANGDWWYADFVPGNGDILAAGSTYSATRYPFNGTGAGMDVSGNGRGCNTLTGTFTVTAATFDDRGRLETFGADFVQHCEGGGPALRGTWELRAGDTTPLPPWMVAGPGTTGPPTTLGPLSGPGTATTAPATPTAPAPTTPAPGTSAPRTATPPCGQPPWIGLPLVRGTSRANRLRGRSVAERMLAGAGNDRVLAGGGGDCVDGGRGDDLILGGRGNDRLFGGAGNDVLAGGPGRDRLFGGAGNDILAGGPGRDRLTCGRGRDVARAVARSEKTTGCERITRPR